MSAEDGRYRAIMDEFYGHRRAGGNIIEAAALTAFWRLALNLANAGQAAQDGS